MVTNAENAAGGTGLTPDVAEELFDLGLDYHDPRQPRLGKREINEYTMHEGRVIRPGQPGSPPGEGSCVVEAAGAQKLGLISLHGRVFFVSHPDDPFQAGAG